MRLSSVRTAALSLLLLTALPASPQERKGSWLIPGHAIAQYAGNMGVLSAGAGWSYGRHRQWETDLLVGWVPKRQTDQAKLTLTLKETFAPWNLKLKTRWALEPLSCGAYLTRISGSDFWDRQPRRYPKPYYWLSTRTRANIFLGQRATRDMGHGKKLTAFYELSTCDMYLLNYAKNRYIGLGDIFSLSVGVKFSYR